MGAYGERLSRKFSFEYDRLNKEQRLAVDTIEGPVMVIAGPGTGKTQILAARIGRILLDTDTSPSNILCLTYTEAGVIAMRKRLQEFIGPDAYKVNIYTFHAFCNDVIQENLSLFEKTALDPISELEQIAFVRDLIDAFPKHHPLKKYRGDVYHEIRNMLSLFATMKKEGWTPAFFNERIDQYLESLPTREEFIYKKATRDKKAGDLKSDKIAELSERMEKTRAAVNEFERYTERLHKEDRYDFDDMINWVIRAFQENKNLLARYQEQFQYILVDEYQDTSGTQNRIVELLINYWDNPNIFVVGDDDQSIFRFQGANIENMLTFRNQFERDLLIVVLSGNYRSIQSILDVSKSLIDRNNERLINKLEGLTKTLTAALPANIGVVNTPSLQEYESERMEMIGVTKEIKKLIAEGVAPGEIAVIYRENKYGEELAAYFHLQKIPYYSKRSFNILDIPLANKIINVLRYISYEHDIPFSGDELLFEIMHYDWFNIPPMEIAKLTVEANEKRQNGKRTSLRQLLNEKVAEPPKDLFSKSANEGMTRACHVLEKLISQLPNVTLQTLFEGIIRETGVLGIIMQQQDKIWQMQVLTGLFDFIKEETRRDPLLRAKDLVSIIDLMEKEDLRLPLVQISGTDKGVNLLTAHGAKGLEFEHVFVAGTVASCWEKKKKPSNGFALPDTLFNSLPGNVEEEELRRLFYVAITRAKHHLNISFSRFKNNGKEQEPSLFISEIMEDSSLEIEKVFINDDWVEEFTALQFSEQRPEIGKMEEDFISRLLDKFVMNVTALNNFLCCPLEFYFVNLIRIPSPKNEAIEFGSAIHHALELLFKNMLESSPDTKLKKFPPKTQFIEWFNWYLHRHRENFTLEQFNRRLEYGHDVLSNYYDKYVDTWNKVVVVERTISNVVVKGVPLKGKLDKLEFDGKNVNVVDYKTGDVVKGSKKINGPNNAAPDGGDYWRQAVFYKILVDNANRGWQVVSTEFDFIEPDTKKIYHKKKLQINPADIETVTQQITSVYQKIMARDFYTGCGKNDCHWCEFVKTNNLAVALHDIINEPESGT